MIPSFRQNFSILSKRKKSLMSYIKLFFLSLYNFTFILPVAFIYCSMLVIPNLHNHERIITHPDWAKCSFKIALLDTFKLHFERLCLKNNAIRLNNNQ